jgi:hypothetical protein
MLLLDKGADINAKNNNGETALSCAADVGETNVVKLLLARKADINAVDMVGETALGIAKRTGNVAIVQLLRQAGATALSASDSSFNVAVASGTNTDSSGYVTNEALLTPFTLTNSVGDVIKNAVLVKLTVDKFVYKTDAGAMGMLPLASLPEDLQKKFGYDLQAAQAADMAAQQRKAREQQKQQQLVTGMPIQSASGEIPATILNDIKLAAAREWPTDFEMQAYKIKTQVAAYSELQQLSPGNVPPDVFQQIKTAAVEEWPGDYEMQVYKIKNQVKAYQDLRK